MENSSRNKILRRSERVALVYLLTNQMTNRQGQMCESKFRNETKFRFKCFRQCLHCRKHLNLNLVSETVLLNLIKSNQQKQIILHLITFNNKTRSYVSYTGGVSIIFFESHIFGRKIQRLHYNNTVK